MPRLRLHEVLNRDATRLYELSTFQREPMSFIRSLKPVIEHIIKRIEEDYRKTKGLILTEDDLKCLIYSKLKGCFQATEHRLLRHTLSSNTGSGLRWRMNTLDEGIYASPVHTEVAWYDDHDKLTIKPDITILEPNYLSILHGIGDSRRLPSKQFQFAGEAIVLELKFIRNKSGITVKTLENSIKKDFNKIERLNSRLVEQQMPDSMFCYFVVFNKTNIVCDEFESFLRSHGESPIHKVIYATGKVTSIR